jgi:hypothetical protein
MVSGATDSSSGGTSTEAWTKIVADPGHSPELLALAAVQTIGPRAREWSDQLLIAYPNATPDARARLAVTQFTRTGSAGTMLALLAGSYAPVTLLGASALTQAQLVLHVAAAYGLDPAAEARAADLLVLTRVHPDHESAAAALAAAKQPPHEDTGLTDAAWRLGRLVAAQAGTWTAVRALNRLFPGTALLTTILSNRASTDALAGRALRHYRKLS